MSRLIKWILVCTAVLFINLDVWSQRRVACIGDSVTKGYGIKDSTKSYPYQLQQLLGSDYVVGNFGHSGATLLKKGHNPYTKTQAYKDALAFDADIIVIALGLNDTDPRNWPNYNNEFVADYTSLIEDFKRKNPNVEVYICNLTPIFSGHKRFLSGTRDWFGQIQALIPSIIKVNQAKFIDNHSVLESRIDLFEDYLHPDVDGAEILANNVYRHLVPIKQPLKVDETFGSHMVLQRDIITNIRGIGNANEKVTILFNGKTYFNKISPLGQWEISLPAQKAGGPYDIKVVCGKQEIDLIDILFGDVYLSSGQSNMAFMVSQASDAKKWIDNAGKHSQIRLFKNKNLVETNNVTWDQETLDKVNRLQYFSGNWKVASPESVKEFSAIAYATGLTIHTAENIPVGIIDVSVGGSNTESWIPRKVLEDDNLLATYIHNWKISDFVQDFCRERGIKNLEKSTLKNQRHPYDPSFNFEAGISKWTNTNIKAILWYQGESNAHNIEHHEYVFKKLVKSWREYFKKDLPFYTVQLSSINRPSWGEFRDSQRRLMNEIPKVYMAVSSDRGHPTDVHPKDKFIIGERLGNLIEQNIYNRKIQANSPQPIKILKHKNLLTIGFSNCISLKTLNNSAVQDFIIMTDKGEKILVEKVELQKNKLTIELPQGAQYIQYGFTPYTTGNLYSDTEVPVSTFNIRID